MKIYITMLKMGLHMLVRSYKQFSKLIRVNIRYASTIFALSSGYGKCGVAVIRVSGPSATEAAVKIAGLKTPLKPRFALLRSLRNPVSNEVLDRGLVIWFPAPNSFTGEDILEFQVHGGPAVISSVLTALSNLPGYRPADPGEFTKRAFHAGKLDLTEVEGLADLIHAETEAQRKQALLQMEGTLSSLYDTWKQKLLKCVAHVEAYIDFSEDENIESDVLDHVGIELKNLVKEIEKHLHDGRRGEILRDGVRTAIVGEPNVGKSSLLNTLCQRPAAIVTPVAGTTRDVVELHANIGGYPVLFADTAGLRNTTDIVEREGISRAHAWASQADLIILVIDVVQYESWLKEAESPNFIIYLKHYILSLKLNEILSVEDSGDSKYIKIKNQSGSKCVIVINKIDLVRGDKILTQVSELQNVILVSCKTEDGFPHLLNQLKGNLMTLCGNPSRENPCLTQSRHRHHLIDCVNSLHQYFKLCGPNNDLTLAAHQLRKSLRHLGKITGEVNTEEVLDIIFKEFCIGK